MIQVCHMTSAHRNDDGRIFKKECVSLAKAGYDVALVARGDSFECDGVSVVGVRSRQGRVARMLLTSRDVYLAAKKTDADVYHFHDPELLPYGLKLAKMGKCVVFDSHENYPSQILTKVYLPQKLRGIISRLYRSYETHACKSFAGVIAPCRFGGESIFEGRARNVAFVGNGCLRGEGELPRWGDAPRESICCLGSLTHARGITHLVKASYLADVHLILCGPISPDYLLQLKAMPEFECAEYRGVLPQEQLSAVMSECFAGAAVGLSVGQYSLADVLPTKVSEYMLNGLPVLLFDSPFNRGFMDRCNCGRIVDVEDIESFAAAIREMRDSDIQKPEMAKARQKYALENLTWQKDEAELLAFYKAIVRNEVRFD